MSQGCADSRAISVDQGGRANLVAQRLQSACYFISVGTQLIVKVALLKIFYSPGVDEGVRANLVARTLRFPFIFVSLQPSKLRA